MWYLAIAVPILVIFVFYHNYGKANYWWDPLILAWDRAVEKKTRRNQKSIRESLDSCTENSVNMNQLTDQSQGKNNESPTTEDSNAAMKALGFSGKEVAVAKAVAKKAKAKSSIEIQLAEIEESLARELIDQTEYDALRRKILGI